MTLHKQTPRTAARRRLARVLPPSVLAELTYDHTLGFMLADDAVGCLRLVTVVGPHPFGGTSYLTLVLRTTDGELSYRLEEETTTLSKARRAHVRARRRLLRLQRVGAIETEYELRVH